MDLDDTLRNTRFIRPIPDPCQRTDPSTYEQSLERVTDEIIRDCELVELRRTCIHEAAHVAVAKSFGAAAVWDVYPRITTAPQHQKLWAGIAYIDTEGLTDRQQRCIALAGVVATELYENPNLQAWEIAEGIEWGDIDFSPQDASLADGYDFSDVVRCMHRVWRLLPTIVEDASHGFRCTGTWFPLSLQQFNTDQSGYGAECRVAEDDRKQFAGGAT